MRFFRRVFPVLVLLALLIFGGSLEVKAGSIYDGWSNGPSKDPSYFMIGVWYQDSVYAPQYKALGINTYVVLGDSPAGLATLKANGMTAVLPADDPASWTLLGDPAFTCWLLPDEPDNCQFSAITINGTVHTGWPLPCASTKVTGSGTSTATITVYNGRIPTSNLLAMYNQIKGSDPTRPIHLGLGQGVANTNYVGRGSAPGGGWTQEYIDYNKACDISGYDIYPYVGMGSPLTSSIDLLWYQAKGLDSLKTSYAVGKPVWNTFECTHIQSSTNLPTPQSIKAEVYMSLIHGSMGLVWFVHEWYPAFSETGLFKYPALTTAVKNVNQQVTALAPVLNTASSPGKATATSSTTVPIDIMVKEYNGYIYILSAGMRNSSAVGNFNVSGVSGTSTVNVLGESRTLTANNGSFTDNFAPWDAHIYQLSSGTSGSAANPLETVRHFPNPVNLTSGNKKARFDTIAVQDVKIYIYNSGGGLVRTIYEKDFGNVGTAEWDLKDAGGETVTAGMYYFVVEDASGNKKKGKLALIK